MIHDINIRRDFADPVLSGMKRFEVRKNDRGYQKGDFLRFHVIDEKGFPIAHGLNNKKAKILYVLSGWGIEPEYVVLSIMRV